MNLERDLEKDEIIDSKTYREELNKDDIFLDVLYWLIDEYNRNYKKMDGFSGIEEILKFMLSRYYRPTNWNCLSYANLYSKFYNYDIDSLVDSYELDVIKKNNDTYIVFPERVEILIKRKFNLSKVIKLIK